MGGAYLLGKTRVPLVPNHSTCWHGKRGHCLAAWVGGVRQSSPPLFDCEIVRPTEDINEGEPKLNIIIDQTLLGKRH